MECCPRASGSGSASVTRQASASGSAMPPASVMARASGSAMPPALALGSVSDRPRSPAQRMATRPSRPSPARRANQPPWRRREDGEAMWRSDSSVVPPGKPVQEPGRRIVHHRHRPRLGGSRRIGRIGHSDLGGDRPDRHDRFATRTSVDDECGLVERDRIPIPVGLLHLHQVVAVVMEDRQPRLDVQGFPIRASETSNGDHIESSVGRRSFSAESARDGTIGGR